MLGPNFMEGQMLTTSHTIELPLYEDNRDALKIVCQILHVRNNDVPQDVYEESLCVIAELTDKYDLAEAIKPTAECWINRWLSRAQKEDPEAGAFEPKHIRPLLVAAYFFQHAELFQRLSTLMVYRSSEVIFDKSEAWAVDDEQSDILRKVFAMLEDKRESTITVLRCDVEDELEVVCTVANYTGGRNTCTDDCNYADIRFANVVRRLHHLGLWPVVYGFIDRSIENITKIMKDVVLKEPDLKLCRMPSTAGMCIGSILKKEPPNSQLHLCHIGKTIRENRQKHSEERPFACYRCARKGEAVTGLGSKADCGHYENRI